MSAYLPIWNLLANTSAQNAMSKADLITKLDMDEADLGSKLDEMYEHRMIGRAKIIKGDVNDMFYWRVGVLKNIGEYGRTSYQQPQIAPPRRDEIAKQNIPQKHALIEKEPMMNTVTNFGVVENKPNALRILEYIEAHPDCNPKQLQIDTGVDYPLSYIKYKIKKYKQVIADQSGGRGNMKLRLAPGLTAEMIYKGRKNNGKHLGKPKSQMIAAAEKQAKAADKEYEIPAFLRKESNDVPRGIGPTRITENEWVANERAMELEDAQKAQVKQISLEPDPIDATAADHIKRLLPHIPEGCHITLRHPEHENIRVEIDGTLLANPIQADLEKLGTVFDAIKTLQHAALL